MKAAQACRDQTAQGACISFAHLPRGPVQDENAFVTALAALEVRALGDRGATWLCGENALHYLRSCERRRRPGAFGFYPEQAQPDWIGAYLPADADDTALCNLALFYAGRSSRAELRRVAAEVLEPYRISHVPAGAPWFRAGTYPTWLQTGRHRRNPIDLCVNLNVAVLLHEADMGVEHSRGIVEMLHAALDWLGAQPTRFAALTPYYPHPAEFEHALERAVRAGLPDAADMLAQLRQTSVIEGRNAADAPVCSGLAGHVYWTSPALQSLRRDAVSSGEPAIPREGRARPCA